MKEEKRRWRTYTREFYREDYSMKKESEKKEPHVNMIVEDCKKNKIKDRHTDWFGAKLFRDYAGWEDLRFCVHSLTSCWLYTIRHTHSCKQEVGSKRRICMQMVGRPIHSYDMNDNIIYGVNIYWCLYRQSTVSKYTRFLLMLNKIIYFE